MYLNGQKKSGICSHTHKPIALENTMTTCYMYRRSRHHPSLWFVIDTRMHSFCTRLQINNNKSITLFMSLQLLN